MEERNTIGKMANIGKVSQKTLRKYDRLGLIKPDSVNAATGYRYYSKVQPWQVGYVQYLKSVGFTLSEIDSLFELDDMVEIEAILDRRIALLEEERKEIDGAIDSIVSMKERLTTYRSQMHEGEFFLERQPRREFVAIPLPDDLVPPPEQFEQFDVANDFWLAYEGRVYEMLAREGLPLTIANELGALFDEGRIASNTLVPSHNISFDMRTAPLGEVHVAPAGLYLSVCFDDTVPIEGKRREIVYLRGLLAEAEERGLEVVGECIDEVLVTGIHRENYTKLQIRVNKGGKQTPA